MTPNKEIKLGLKENWKQFTLLLIINAFVGGMVGLERTILPSFAENKFDIVSGTVVLSFIAAFGITKAIANYFAGKLANLYGRRKLLLYGWLIAMAVPFILIYAPSWNWVIFANVLLGISQGLTWSSTVVMKIDLVGEKDRGLAMGLNEFSGYLMVGIVALISGIVADRYGVSKYPFYIGIALSVLGFLMTLIWIKDTRKYVQQESKTDQNEQVGNVFIETTFKHKTLSSVTQAGLVNNLNDGMLWGLLPILLISYQYDTKEVALIASIYPTVWGIGQLFTGKLSDIYNKKRFLFLGMLFQGIAILTLPYTSNFSILIFIGVVLGLGTAMVYPTFLSIIASVTTPNQRAESIGVFRLWRDLGYAFGAIISGIIADQFGIEYAILSIGALTVLSSLVIQFRMPK